MSQKNTLQIIIMVLVLGGTLTTFTNCGQPGQIDLKGQTTGTKVDDPTVIETITNCVNAANEGKIQEADRVITFNDTLEESGGSYPICEFAPTGTQLPNGNLDMGAEQLRARYTQERKLNLPANAVICDIDMETNVQDTRYDDVFFINFNNILLATNDKTAVSRRLTPVTVKMASNNSNVDFYTYDWMELRTAGFVNQADDYCLGADQGLATCQWPVSEIPGSFYFKFAPEVLIRASANTKPEDQAFTMVITGDDDPSKDCYHPKVEFSMKVKYYLK